MRTGRGGIFAVMVALERCHQLVGLHAADYANKQMIDRHHAAHALDGVGNSIPSFEPEFIILAAAISRHIQKQRRQLIAN